MYHRRVKKKCSNKFFFKVFHSLGKNLNNNEIKMIMLITIITITNDDYKDDNNYDTDRHPAEL